MGALGGLLARLGGLSGPLGGILAQRGIYWTYLGVSRPILAASWNVLGRFLGPPGGRRGRIRRDPSLGFFRIFLGCYYVYPKYIQRIRKFARIKERKEDEKKVRVWDFVRHAQAQGLARRIQSAAKLRTRHRAWCLMKSLE